MISSWYWWFQSLKNFFSPILDLSPNYFCLQIHYLDFYSYAFFHFAHYDRPQRFLAGTGGFSRQKILFCLKGPIKLCLQIIFVSKFIFSTYTHMFISIMHIVIENDEF